MKAGDRMTPRPHVVLAEEPVLRAAEIMRDHDVGIVPVVDGRESMGPVGVVTGRDLAVRHAAAAHHPDCPVREHTTADPLVTVRPGADGDEVMKRMRRYRARRVMVADGDGVLRRVIAQADLVGDEGEAPDREGAGGGLRPRRASPVAARDRSTVTREPVR